MSRCLRRLLWISSVVTGATGLVYMWMKHFMEAPDAWAVINHPWEPWFLKAHILAAPVMLFSVGLVAGYHILRHFHPGLPTGRRSGILVGLVLLPMVASGYLIQAVTHTGVLNVLAWTHFWAGVVYLCALVVHSQAMRMKKIESGARSRTV